MKKVVAVGALGGSGTRVVAQILMKLGINLGEVLNYPNDNLIFTALFKSPKWYKTSSKKDFQRRLRIFDKFMSGEILSINEKWELFKSSFSNKTIGRDYLFYYKVFIRKRSLRKLNLWGWKEPNTQIYLEEINDFYPKIKYIHVLRNGLDMAFSKNKYQLNNWGFKHNIFVNDSDDNEQISIKQLDYWIESTKDILNMKYKLKDRLYLLNYTSLCIKPEQEISKILNFLGIDISTREQESLIELVKIPNSFNRYEYKDTSFFRDDQLEFLKKMGFSID